MKTVLCGIRGETGGYSKKKDSGLLVKWKLFGLNNREADSESQSGGPVTQGGHLQVQHHGHNRLFRAGEGKEAGKISQESHSIFFLFSF